jgi:hydrogenase maturation factor
MNRRGETNLDFPDHKTVLPTGKIPPTLLRRLLNRLDTGRRDPSLLVGPGIGLDAAAVRVGRRTIVLKTDPITFVAADIGAYALTINANDLATMGARPRWFLATMLLPAGCTSGASVSRLFSQLHAACRELEVALCGGHMEITDAVTRPVIVGCLLGECERGRPISSAGAKVGDALLLTKGIPIEAVSILARERERELARRYPRGFVAICRRYLRKPGISVVPDAQLALATGGVHAMHDPTEGGLSAALYELAEASGTGALVEERAIRILPEGARLCADFGLNPLGAIASGALLISAEPGKARRILHRLGRAGIPATRIGAVVAARRGVRLITRAGAIRPMPRFRVDELARFLAGRSGLRRGCR